MSCVTISLKGKCSYWWRQEVTQKKVEIIDLEGAQI